MGLFDSLFGGSTSAPQQNAAWAAEAADQALAAQNRGTLTNAAGAASSALNQGSTAAQGALTSYLNGGMDSIRNYGGQAQDALGRGVNTAVGTVQGSNANYQPYAASGGAATGALSDALGLNGPAGNAAAQAAFTSSPGYAYTLQQTTDAAQRAAAAAGINASGNTLTAISKLASKLSDQNFQQYVSNLSGLGSQGLQAASGISNNNTAAGGYEYGGGGTSANLFQNTGTQLGALSQALGTSLGTLDYNTGVGQSNIQTGLGNSLVNSDTAAQTAINNANLGAANATASATNANNGILSNALKNLGSFALSGGTGAGGGSLGGLLNRYQHFTQNQGYL